MRGDGPSETRVAGLHLPVALALVAVGVGILLVDGLESLAVLRAAFPLALGGFVVLIVGTSRMLLAGTAGVGVAGKPIWWLPGLLVAAGSVGLQLAFGGRPRLLTPASVVWGTGLGLHVSLLGFSLARGRTQTAITQGWPVGLTTLAALGYGLASAVAVPMVALGWLGLFAALHLLLTGFVVLVIAAVVLEVLPRFTGNRLPRAGTAAMAVTLALGPALLAEGFEGAGSLLFAGALVEGLGLAILGLGLVGSVFRAQRQRASFWLYAVAGATVLVGAGLGTGMALGWLSHAHAPWHGVVNLLGFVGLLVLGAVIDLFAPALAPGAQRLGQHNTAVVGLALAGTGGLLAAPWLHLTALRFVLGVYLAAVVLHLAGSVARLAR